MNKYQEEANSLYTALQETKTVKSIYVGIINEDAVFALLLEGTLYFEHNISGMKRPTKAEAVALLDGLVAYYEALCQNSTDLTAFVAGKDFVAELIVFSGQMDFKVASWQKKEITWHTNLDE